MDQLILFAVGSPLIVDYEETCQRLGVQIVAGIQNRAGDVFLSDPWRLRQLSEVGDTLRAVPCLCPLFSPHNRRAANDEAAKLGFAISLPLIDPTAILARSTDVKIGSYINAGVAIGAASSLGRCVVINRGAILGHHSRIDDYASVGPGVVAAGQVEIGAGAMIGAGAVILPKIRIGAFSIVGAGAVVTRDVPDRAVVVGNPASIIERKVTASASLGIDA